MSGSTHGRHAQQGNRGKGHGGGQQQKGLHHIFTAHPAHPESNSTYDTHNLYQDIAVNLQLRRSGRAIGQVRASSSSSPLNFKHRQEDSKNRPPTRDTQHLWNLAFTTCALVFVHQLVDVDTETRVGIHMRFLGR